MRRDRWPETALTLALLALAACADARGFNAYEAACADRHRLTPGTDAFRACAAQEEADFVDAVRQRKGYPGSP